MPEDVLDEKTAEIAEPTEEITSFDDVQDEEDLEDENNQDLDDTEDEETAPGDKTDAAEIDVATAGPTSLLQLIMAGPKTKHDDKWVFEVSDEVVGRIHQLLSA